MKTLLQINTSLNGSDSLSSSLASEYAATWLAANPHGELVIRDLSAQPVPHLSAQRFAAFGSDPATRSPEQQALVVDSDKLIAELKDADEIVLGLPMHNFGIPSTLKAYFDHIARAGETFRYSESGPVGLLNSKRVLIFATRGGIMQGTPLDTQTAYVNNFLGFLGLTQTQFIYVEGTAMGGDHLQAGIAEARGRIRQLSSAA